MHRSKVFSLCLVGVLTTILLACNDKSACVYAVYQHTPIEGWDRNDTLTFCYVPNETYSPFASQPSLTLTEEIGLRINGSYPFSTLYLIVEQEVRPSATQLTDTLTCRLTDKKGVFIGKGIGCYQYLFPLRRLPLHTGDTLNIHIRHLMKREILPGVTDIGVSLFANEVTPGIDTQEDKQQEGEAPER